MITNFTSPNATSTPSVSVQDLYRPVVVFQREGGRIPGIPKVKGDKAYVWWKEQIRRCKYGWTVEISPATETEPAKYKYLNGLQYYYLNFVKIPIQDNQTKTISGWEAPFYRDNDETILWHLWRNMCRTLPNGVVKNAKNHVEAKCRSIGWTQMEFLGCDSYLLIFQPGRERQIGRGYSDDEVIGKEREWFRKMYAQLPDFLKTWDGRELKVVYDNKDQFAVGYIENGITIIHNAIQYKIVSTETDAGVFKGQRMLKITAVEAGKWKGDSLVNFYSENQDSLEIGADKWGMFVIGGTSNAVINKATNYRDIFYKPEAFNATRHFTPKTMVLAGSWNKETGESNQTHALQRIKKEREDREGNPTAYRQYVIENPLTPEEAFIPSELTTYDSAKIDAQIGFVKESKVDDYWIRGEIVYERDALNNIIYENGLPLVYFKQAARLGDPGFWWVNRQALPTTQYENLHIGAIDDTYKGSKEGQRIKAKDSKNCMLIWRQPTVQDIKNDVPCAYFLHKTPDMDEIYEEFYKGMLLYNVRQTLYEYNHDGFVNFLRDRRESSRLYYIDKQPGITFKTREKAEATALGHRFFAAGRHENITLVPLLESLKRWGSASNDDLASAFHILLILLDLTKEHSVVERLDRYSAENRNQGRVLLAQQTADRPVAKNDGRIRLGLRLLRAS